MKVVLQVRGGIGKSVMATAVCKAIQTQYPGCKIIVLTAYPGVFMGNRRVYKAMMEHEMTYFYREHVMDQPDTKFCLLDPYLTDDFIHRRGHLIKVWCEMNGIKYNGELPEIFLTHKEMTSFGLNLKKSNKPILALQTNGGMSTQGDKYSWPRDLPLDTAQKIVNALAAHYNIFHIHRPDNSCYKTLSLYSRISASCVCSLP